MADFSQFGAGAGTGAAIGSFLGPIGTGVGALAGGLISSIFGGGQKKKANQILADNPYPTYNIPNEITANQRLAQTNANNGLPSQQYNLAQQNIQRQRNAALSAANDRRGGLAALPGIEQSSDNALGNLDAANASARMQNQQRLMQANSQLAGYKDKAFGWNTQNKYNQNYNYAMGLLGAGNQNTLTGIDKGLSGLLNIGAGIFGGGSGGYGGNGNNSVGGYYGDVQAIPARNSYMNMTPQHQ